MLHKQLPLPSAMARIRFKFVAVHNDAGPIKSIFPPPFGADLSAPAAKIEVKAFAVAPEVSGRHCDKVRAVGEYESRTMTAFTAVCGAEPQMPAADNTLRQCSLTWKAPAPVVGSTSTVIEGIW